MIPSEVPPRAWHTVGMDLFHLNGHDFLLVADYFSKFPFVRKLGRESSSSTVINILKQLFGEFGIPQIVRSDNGPQFSSHAFKQFAEAYGFDHVSSSPHYPKSNGFIESQVKLVKHSLSKVVQDNGDPQLALLRLRTTPLDSKLPSPAELLQGRTLRDDLPQILRSGHEDVIGHLHQRQESQKATYDRVSKPLAPLAPQQPVRTQNPTSRQWEPATVIQRNDQPRSYKVMTAAGSTVDRNRSQLRPCDGGNDSVKANAPASHAPAPIAEQPSTPATPEPNQPAPSPSEYITRSGRQSTAPKRLDL